MSLCANVYRRGGIYWFRKKIVIGKGRGCRVIAVSLLIREPARAKVMAAALNAQFISIGPRFMAGEYTLGQVRAILTEFIRKENAIHDAGAFRHLSGQGDILLDIGEDLRTTLVRDDRAIGAVYGLVAKHGADLKFDDALAKELKDQGYSLDERDIIRDMIKGQLRRLAAPGPDALGPPVEYFRDLLTREGIQPSAANIYYFWREWMKIRAKVLADTDRRYANDLVDLDDLFEEVARGGPSASRQTDANASTAAGPSRPKGKPVTEPEDHLFMIWGEKFIADLEYKGDTENPKHRRNTYRLFSLLLIEHKIFDLTEIHQTHFAAYKEMFKGFPTSYGQSSQKQTLENLRLRGQQVPEKKRGIVAKTLNRHFSDLSQLLGFISSHGGTIAKNLEPNKLQTKKVKRDRGKRKAFDFNELKDLFSLGCFTGCAGWKKAEPFQTGAYIFHRGLYFATLMLCYSGARREEVCGLEIADLFFDEPVPYFAIRGNSTRRIKNDYSGRFIPIHPEVLRLGFREYIAALKALDYALVFPDLKSPTSNSPLGDRLYDEFIVGLKAAVPEQGKRKKVIHSLRHALGSTLKREKVDSEVRADILGHAGDTTTEETYADATEISTMLGELLKFPLVTEHLEPAAINLLPWVRAKKTPPFSMPNKQKGVRRTGDLKKFEAIKF